MKLCPSCHAQYADDTLNYCLNDGTPLVKETIAQAPQATLVLPAGQIEPNRPTQGAGPYARTEQLPPRAAPTSQTLFTNHPKRSVTPWLIAGAILLLSVVGIGLVAAFVISGSRNSQSAASGNGNSSSSRNYNNNQSRANSSSSQPYAAFADRTGRYHGKAINTTSNTQGTITLDITTIDADSGEVSSMLTSGGNLCGDAPLEGQLTEEGKMNLSGTLTCKIADYSAPMKVRCQFATTDTLSCTYTLSNSNYTPAIQQGNFRITKQ